LSKNNLHVDHGNSSVTHSNCLGFGRGVTRRLTHSRSPDDSTTYVSKVSLAFSVLNYQL